MKNQSIHSRFHRQFWLLLRFLLWILIYLRPAFPQTNKARMNKKNFQLRSCSSIQMSKSERRFIVISSMDKKLKNNEADYYRNVIRTSLTNEWWIYPSKTQRPEARNKLIKMKNLITKNLLLIAHHHHGESVKHIGAFVRPPSTFFLFHDKWRDKFFFSLSRSTEGEMNENNETKEEKTRRLRFLFISMLCQALGIMQAHQCADY